MLDALLRLSDALVGTRQGGLLTDALHAVLGALGCARGAAFAASEGALVLAGERGLPAELRASLDRLPLGEPPWFIAQRAAGARGLVAGRAVAGSGGGRLDAAPAAAGSGGGRLEAALAAAGWAHAAACPIVVEREVLGVLVIAAAPGELGAPAAAILRIACNLMALQMARAHVDQRLREYRSGDARSARLSAFGLLAGGFAGEITPAVAALEEGIAEQRRVIERLRGPEAEELAALAARSAGVAREVRESAARLHAAVRSGTVAERLDLGAVVMDALALLGPALRGRRIELHAACPGGHFIVGRRGELLQLFLHVLLNVAGLGDEEGAAGGRGRVGPRRLDVRLYRHEAREVLSIDAPGEDVVSARTRLLASPVIAPPDGQGLGFAAARQIVSAHRGHLALDPSDAGGVRCEVVLPAEGAFVGLAEGKAPAGAPPPRPAGRRPSILWIDDDELTAEIVVQSLDSCEIHVARTAAEATRHLFKGGAPPTLIFCGVRLPDRSGPELHRDVASFSAETAERFVFISDGVLSMDAADHVMTSGCPTLTRPVAVDEIREMVFAERGAAARGAAKASGPVARSTLAWPAIAPATARPDRSTVPEPGPAQQAIGRLTVPEPATARSARAASAPPDVEARGNVPPSRARVISPNRVEVTPAPGSRRDPRFAPTEPSYQATPAPGRDAQLAGMAAALAATLQREGPKRGPTVLEMLHRRGLSEAEALSVVALALSTGVLVRDPPWSTMLRAPEPPTEAESLTSSPVSQPGRDREGAA